jgi:DNA processing protein
MIKSYAMTKNMKNIYPWFALKSVKGIGNYLFKKLIERFETPEKVFEASKHELVQIKGISKTLAHSVLNHTVPDNVKLDMELVFQNNIKIVTLNDKNYPTLLLQIHDPPPFLYLYGNLEGESLKIAFVGSRSATEYGISLTKSLCRHMAKMGFTIVSGMARGIDTYAHKGALDGKGKTIAVLGSGLKKIYPKENINLFHKIAEKGAIISEFPLMAEPEPHNFPARNRIISGLSLGTVVIEAGIKSGSLITARFAIEQNREVFAVPGNVTSIKNAGSHKLIKQGAKLVENVQDIIEELPCASYDLKQTQKSKEKPKQKPIQKEAKEPQKRLDLKDEEKKVLNILTDTPIHIDAINQKLSIDMGKLLGILLHLELKGIVKKHFGNFFSSI